MVAWDVNCTFAGVEVPETIWSAASLLSAPEVVQQIHQDFIEAGADIITTIPTVLSPPILLESAWEKDLKNSMSLPARLQLMQLKVQEKKWLSQALSPH